MSWVSRIANVFRPGRTTSDLDQELQFHIEERVDELLRSGMPRTEAQFLARRQLGSPLRLRESGYDIVSAAWLDSLFRDFRCFCGRCAGRNT